MSIRPIHLLGSPALRERATEIERVDAPVTALIDDLVDTMRADGGIGLAANQIGIPKRVAVVAAGAGQPLVLINPVILEREGTSTAEEGCLSIPDIFVDIERAARIAVETTGRDGQRVRVDADDLKARAIQHEIDHLDGLLIIDHASPLKRRLLLNKWRRLRKGKEGFLKEVSAAAVEE